MKSKEKGGCDYSFDDTGRTKIEIKIGIAIRKQASPLIWPIHSAFFFLSFFLLLLSLFFRNGIDAAREKEQKVALGVLQFLLIRIF